MIKFYLRRHRNKVTMKAMLLSIFSFFYLNGNSQLGNGLYYTGNGTNGNGYLNQQYLQLPAGIVQSVGGEYTVEAWVKWSSTAVSAWQRIFDFGTGTGNFMFLTPSSSSNQVRFAIVSGSTTEYVDASIQFPQDVWTHVAISVDNSSVGRLFIGGVLQGSASFTLRPASLGNTTANYLGKSQFLPDPFFNGGIDELRISNVARYTSNFTPQTSQFTNDANTVALFHFNEGTGQQTFDVTSTLTGVLGFSTASEPDLDPTWISGILPVKMESFTAQKQNNTVDLKWQASTTGEGGSFVVERSTDGRQFENIATVAMKDPAGSFSYSYKDNKPAAGKNYYKLRILENNASEKWSSVIWVDMNRESQFSVSPTLTASTLFVNVATETRITIYNTSGVEVMDRTITASQNLDVSNLPKGAYFIKNSLGQTTKFIKQ